MNRASIPIVALCSSILARAALGQATTLESVDSRGVPVPQGAHAFEEQTPVLSPSGRYLAFVSESTELVVGDTNSSRDVFVRDRQTGWVERVSLSDADQQVFGTVIGRIDVSDDGRYVVFVHTSAVLVAGDANVDDDVFLRDRVAGSTTRLSVSTAGVEANQSSYHPDLTADGRFAAFFSNASNLVAGDSNARRDVFVRDVVAGTLVRVSLGVGGVQGDGHSFDPAISDDGTTVAFTSSATNLVAGDTNGSDDVFVRDLVAGTAELVSLSVLGGSGNGQSDSSCISSDGRFVGFRSAASDLIAGDVFTANQIFVRDRSLAATEKVSLDSFGLAGNGDCTLPAITGDGRYVSFASKANDLVPFDTNVKADIFVRDRTAASTSRASIGYQGGQTFNYVELGSSISADGRWVAFVTDGSTLVLGDATGYRDAFVRDMTEPPATLATYCTAKVSSQGCTPTITPVGAPTATGFDSFFLVAQFVLSNKPGLLIWSRASAALPFGGGTLCVAPPIARTPAQTSTTDAAPCSSDYSFAWTQLHMQQELVFAGDTIYAQFWSRDPGYAAPNNIGLTHGVRFTVAP